MTAQDVYNIAKALPKEEYIHLFTMINNSLKNSTGNKNTKQPVLTDIEAQQYLLENIFSKKSIQNRLKTSKS